MGFEDEIIKADMVDKSRLFPASWRDIKRADYDTFDMTRRLLRLKEAPAYFKRLITL